jgi:tetratricopeptide (TPR) repeat protein
MNIVIRIAPECSEDKRSIFFTDEISHHVREKDIQEILKESNRNFWKTDSTNGAELGRRLYGFLNGSAGHIDSLIEESRQKGEPLSIYLDIPYTLNSLPVELLYDDEYLVRRDHPKTFIIRSVSDRCSRQEHTPETRPLKVLFIACSPLDLRSQEVLQFEKEEEQILSAVEKFPVEVVTEDLGSLTGLFDKLYEEGPFDVVHITGHAGHDHELGPVFYMEDDIGRLDKVTPDRLWKKALKDFTPRLLFLSGCSTGKGDKVNSAESFAHSMVEKGVPLVLGWGLPVSDVGATAMTQVLYKYLGMGKGVIEAVNNAIKDISDRYHPWPLLRLFTDGSPLTAFITAGQKIRYAPVRKTRYKFLADSYVKVLEKGFVGRRREIQKGVRTLKGMPDEQGVSRNGLIVRGPAGVGKSCLAGKLIERFKDLELVVLHGLLKGEGDVLVKLRRLFDRRGESDGVAIIKSDLTYEDKIKKLFRTIFHKLPVMLYFDDFEDNLVNRGDCREIKRAVIPLLRPLFQAIDWHEIEARMLITSRYPFKLELEGENLFNKLVDITLLSFKDADLYKKCAELPNILASEHRKMYLRYGGGNPRLLEWLEIIAKDENKYDIDSLRQALEGKNEDYIREYLADILADTEGEAFSEFLQKASVFKQPVDQTAFKGIGTVDSLSKGVDLTLLEKEEVSGHKPVFWVNPVIRKSQWAKLSRSEQKQIHKIAMNWYDHEISTSDSPDHEYLQEVLYHALASDNIRIACRHSITLGQYLESLLLYKDKQQVQQTVADRITDHVIEEAISQKDENISVLLNNLGITYRDLGEANKAIEYYEKSLEIDLKVFGDQHPKVAIRYNNLGSAYNDLGNANKAIEYLEKSLEIDLKVFGDQHPNVAIRYNNFGLAYRALGEANKAIEYYEKSLEVISTFYGKDHPSTKTVNKNLNSIKEQSKMD